MTYSEAFPLWVAEVYRNHGYEPDKWYGSEVAETLYNEAMATYNGPPATMRDYIEAIPSADEFAYLDYAIERLRRDNINLNALSDKERWALMDKSSQSIRSTRTLAHPMPSRYSRLQCRRRSMPSVMFSCRLLGTMRAGTVRQRMLQRIL